MAQALNSAYNLSVPVAEELAVKREDVTRIAAKHGVRRICVFGSSARADVGDGSDVDFLIESGEFRTQFFPGGLVADLEQLLGRSVDVTTLDALHPLMRAQILAEAVEP